MRKRMLSGIRDLWIVLFCLMERTLLQILLAVPVPVRMVLVGVLAAKYVECLFCTSLSMTILTVVMTVFVSTNIKKWNAEFQIIYAMARIRKRSRKKVYNFIQNKKSTGSRKAARFFSQVMYHLWAQNEPRIVPKRKEQAFPTFVYQYAPKIDPHLGGNQYMEWFTFERKRHDTMHRTTGSGHMFSEGSRKGTYFLGQAAQNLTVQSKVCAKNFLVNIVYKFCK